MLQFNINDQIQFDIISYDRDTCFSKGGHGSQAYIDFIPSDATLNKLYTLASNSQGTIQVHTLTIIYTDEKNINHTYRMQDLEAEITGIDEIWDGKDLHGHLIIIFALDGRVKPQTNIFS